MLNESSHAELFSNSSEPDRELLVLYIEICENNTQVLTVHQNDNVAEVVQQFCDAKELTPSAQVYLLEEVEKTLQYYYPTASTNLPGSLDQELTSEIKLSACNKGVELYIRGQKTREKTEKKREMIRNERKRNEDKMVTLKPVVNKSPKRTKKPEQILLEKGRQAAENLFKKKTLIEAQEKSECTFSPEINRKKNETRSPDRYQRLYEDAQSIHEKIKKKSMDLISLSCPFEPNFALTKKKTDQLAKNFSRSNTLDQAPTRTASPSPYAKKQRFESPKKSLGPDRSQQILEKVKKSRFQQIFAQLLPDSKGRITSETVYKAKLAVEMQNVLKPILKMIEEESLNFNEAEFCSQVEQLLKHLTPGEKAILLQTSKKGVKEMTVRSASATFQKSYHQTVNFQIKSLN